MPITFTDDAVNLLSDIMKKQGLSTNQYAIHFMIEDGALAFNFFRDTAGCNQIKDLKYLADPRIEEDIVISSFRQSDGTAGIIFLGKDEIIQ